MPEERLWALMAACDACVRLRAPTMGETSGSAIRALSLGKPLVVSDVGWFAELPDDVAIKVPVDEREIEALDAALERAAASPEMGAAALRLAETEHDLGRVAISMRGLRLGRRPGRAGPSCMRSPTTRRCRRPARGSPTTPRCSCPALSERLDVVVARPGRFRRDPHADVALYHVGNDAEAHGWIVEALRRRPGVVVLHDFVLHHLVVGLTFGRGDMAGYLSAMEREAGLVGRLLGYAVLDNKIPPLWETRPEDFPMAGEVLQLATGVIAHSRYVEQRAREIGFEGPIRRIAHPAWPDPQVEPAAVDGAPLFGCFGNLTDGKRIPQLLRAFEQVRGRHPAARLLLVGAASRGSARSIFPRGSCGRTTSTSSGCGR